MINSSLAKPQTYLALIAINLVASFLFLRAAPLKEDYRSFYQAGQAARISSQLVYDIEVQRGEQAREFGSYVPFFHPPQELLLFVPLSFLPYSKSLLVWRVLMIACAVFSGLFIAKALRLWAWLGVAIVAAMYPFDVGLSYGQDSLLLLLVVAASFLLAQEDREVAAGALLSLALFKPQLPLLLAIAMLAFRRWRFAAAFAVTASILGLASIAYVRKAGVVGLLNSTKIAETEVPIFQMPTLRGVITRFFGDHQEVAAALSLILVLCFLTFVHKRATSVEFVFAGSICLYCVVAHHLFAHDAVALALPFAAYLARPLSRYDWLLASCVLNTSLFVIVVYLHVTALMVLSAIFLGFASVSLNAMLEPTLGRLEGDLSPARARKEV